MSKPRKKYRPKPVYLNPIDIAIAKVRPVDEEGRLELNIKHSEAVAAISQGIGNKTHWDTLAGICNVAKLLSEAYFQKSYMLEIERAKNAVNALKMRFKQMHKFIFRGEELSVINQLLLIVEEMYKRCTQKELSSIIAGLQKGRFAV